MNDFDITKTAFITTSKENWMMLKKVGKDDTYEIIQQLADYILEGIEPECNGCSLASLVVEQFKSVIDRKGMKKRNSVGNLTKGKKTNEEPQDISTAPIVNIPPLEEEVHTEPIPTQTIEKEEEAEDEEDFPIPEEESVITLREGLDVKEIVKDLSDVYIGDGKRAVMDRIKWYTNQYGIPSLDLWNQLKVVYPEIQATKK